MEKVGWALLALFVLHTSAQAADKIRVATPDLGGQFLTFPLAQKKGFFKEEGLDTEIIIMRPDITVAALSKGEIDYATAVAIVVRGAIQRFPIKVVACYAPSSTLTVVGRPELKSLNELKGKTIGINTYGGAVEIITRTIVKQAGLSPNQDVKFVAMGSAGNRFAALKQGLIAATVVSPPFDFEGEKLGFHVLARAYELFNFPQAGLGVNVKKIQEKPDEIKRVIKAGIKANRYIRENREGTIQVLMEVSRVNKEIAEATYESIRGAFNEDGSLPEKGFRVVIEETKNVLKVGREVSSAEVADLSILRRAQKELGIAAR